MGWAMQLLDKSSSYSSETSFDSGMSDNAGGCDVTSILGSRDDVTSILWSRDDVTIILGSRDDVTSILRSRNDVTVVEMGI
jgi:hypothetical protein